MSESESASRRVEVVGSGVSYVTGVTLPEELSAKAKPQRCNSSEGCRGPAVGGARGLASCRDDRSPGEWQTRPVTEQPAASPEPSPQEREVTDDRAALESLVGDWLTVPEAAERLGVPLSRIRQLIADREVLALRVGERRVVAVPARFLAEDGPRSELKGTFTVLADSGLSDDEIIEWLFTPDPTLPVPGAPIDSLWAGHKTEIRRRAQELAF